MMTALEKAKIALRKDIQKNKEKIAKDLEVMRSKSQGNDIFKYLDNVAKPIKKSQRG